MFDLIRQIMICATSIRQSMICPMHEIFFCFSCFVDHGSSVRQTWMSARVKSRRVLSVLAVTISEVLSTTQRVDTGQPLCASHLKEAEVGRIASSSPLTEINELSGTNREETGEIGEDGRRDLSQAKPFQNMLRQG